MPGACRNFCIALSNGRDARPLRQQLARQRAGRDAGDDGLGGRMGLARGEPHAGRPAAGGGDLRHLGVGENLAAGGDQHLFQRADHGVGATLAEHHAKALVGHRFQIGEHRAARDVGCEVEMHAPGGERRLHMVGLEILVEPGARRGEQQSRAISSAPATPFLRQAFQAVPASARMLIGEPSNRNRCSASPGNAATRRRHVSASAWRERAMRAMPSFRDRC